MPASCSAATWSSSASGGGAWRGSPAPSPGRCRATSALSSGGPVAAIRWSAFRAELRLRAVAPPDATPLIALRAPSPSLRISPCAAGLRESTLSTSTASACTSVLGAVSQSPTQAATAPARHSTSWSSSLSAPMKYIAMRQRRTSELSSESRSCIIACTAPASTICTATSGSRASRPRARTAPLRATSDGQFHSICTSWLTAESDFISARLVSSDVRELRV
mmetsp:Transcript_25718/g.61253  ORF Transcript_25718/g.61253 Transcript_25718/m.61253 type:complete len:221 (-) Transcript_25718:832-1494(-)